MADLILVQVRNQLAPSSCPSFLTILIPLETDIPDAPLEVACSPKQPTVGKGKVVAVLVDGEGKKNIFVSPWAGRHGDSSQRKSRRTQSGPIRGQETNRGSRGQAPFRFRGQAGPKPGGAAARKAFGGISPPLIQKRCSSSLQNPRPLLSVRTHTHRRKASHARRPLLYLQAGP